MPGRVCSGCSEVQPRKNLFSFAARNWMSENRYPCDNIVLIEQEPRHHLVIVNEFVRAFAVEIAPHDRTLCHHHAHEYLMYVAGDAQIASAPRDGEPATHTYHDGDCELSPPGLIHVVKNLRDTEFRNLLVEFLPEFGDLRRGPVPTTTSVHVTISPRFEDKLSSVFLLQMDTGLQVEISGPAIVATPYNNPLEFAASQSSPRTLERFTDLVWIAPYIRARLRNPAASPARAVLVALGQR